MDGKMMNKLEDLVAFLKEEYEDKIDVNIIKFTDEDKIMDFNSNKIVNYSYLQSKIYNQWNFPLPGGWNFPLSNHFKYVGCK